MHTMDMSLAAHVKAGRDHPADGLERCHDAEELQRLIGSTGALSAFAGGGNYDEPARRTSELASAGGGWAGDAGTTGS